MKTSLRLRYISLSNNSNTGRLTTAPQTRKTMEAFITHTNIKIKYPDAIILMRNGDFYETFSRDAQDVSRICGTTLTIIPTGQEQTMFPYHALDTYLPKLIRAGKRIAICDATM